MGRLFKLRLCELVITALYWVFRRYARSTALLVALVLGTHWFAFLHMPGNPVAALLMAAIQVLPMTYLWLRRGLEAAIGLHIGVDPVRLLARASAVVDLDEAMESQAAAALIP